MKIKLNDLLIIIFLILISFVLKQVQFVPLIISVLVIFFAQRLDSGIKNLIYIAIATIPFLPFFVFFVFYIPFVIFGTIFENSSFIKKYVFGISVTLVLRLIVFYLSMLHIPISEYLILILLFCFLLVSYSVFIRKNNIASLKKIFLISAEDYKILLITLFFLFFVSNVIYNNTSLYGSNGTQIYTKQFFVIDTLEKYRFFPLYDPSIGMGEQLFITDSPAHFTKDILIMSTIFLKKWFGPVLVYNAYSIFILWVVVLGASLLLREILSVSGMNNGNLDTYFVILGSLAIGLSFQFVRILESFKSFSAHTINLLLFTLIISKPKKAVEWFVICYLMLFSFMVHAIQSIGVFILALSLLIVFYSRDFESVKLGYNYLIKNKFKVIFVIIVFVGVMLAYTATGYIYKDYLRESPKGFFGIDPVGNIILYINQYFTEKNTTPFSIKYPDLNRLDTKHSGFFLSFVGGFSFIYIILNFKNEKLKKARLFNYAFALNFLLYAMFIHSFNVGNLEPGYRIILPYTVVVLSISISVFFSSFGSKHLRILLALVFFGFLLHSLFYVRINMANIHSESIISESVLKNEADFIRKLPIDGRFITYGLFSNAVDASLASTTGRYFTRYQYNLWTEVNNIYIITHTQNSFGDFDGLSNMSGRELRNYYAMGGYNYMLVNTCTQTGYNVVQKMYPNYTTPLYQNQCLVMLMVKNATYANKASVFKNVDENVYKNNEDGYKYISISRLARYGFDPDKIVGKDPEVAINPVGLGFKRINSHEVEISGDFKDGDWVNFKEEYFPRWKAYMNGIEVPIYATNHNMMLIKAVKGNSIVLRYDILNIEKVFSFVSLIAVILCSAIFILLLKYELY